MPCSLQPSRPSLDPPFQPNSDHFLSQPLLTPFPRLSQELERETNRAQPVFPVVTPLNETVAELGGYYTLMEQAQLESFLHKAIEMDEVKGFNGLYI